MESGAKAPQPDRLVENESHSQLWHGGFENDSHLQPDRLVENDSHLQL
jgi:hypothetical protein